MSTGLHDEVSDPERQLDEEAKRGICWQLGGSLVPRTPDARQSLGLYDEAGHQPPVQITMLFQTEFLSGELPVRISFAVVSHQRRRECLWRSFARETEPQGKDLRHLVRRRLAALRRVHLGWAGADEESCPRKHRPELVSWLVPSARYVVSAELNILGETDASLN